MPKFELILSRFRMGAEQLNVMYNWKKWQKKIISGRCQVSPVVLKLSFEIAHGKGGAFLWQKNYYRDFENCVGTWKFYKSSLLKAEIKLLESLSITLFFALSCKFSWDFQVPTWFLKNFKVSTNHRRDFCGRQNSNHLKIYYSVDLRPI